MRTPNTTCVLCAKPLYRRPNELARVRYAACMGCRSRAQSVVGVTAAQRTGLSKGSVKGTNHRTGYSHREESKAKVSASNRAFWAANPELAKARAEHCRGEGSYNWKGGVSRLNISIRQMTENRNWTDAVRDRDMRCRACGSEYELEAHHIIPLSGMIESLGIKNRDDARSHSAILWDLKNGHTLCRACHADQHGRVYTPTGSGRKYCRSNRGYGKFCGKDCFNATKRA